MKKESRGIFTPRRIIIALAVICALLIGWYVFNHTPRAYSIKEHDFDISEPEEIRGKGILLQQYYGKAAHLRIPAEINGLPVLMANDCCFVGNSRLKTVRLPDSMKIIPRFEYCTSLQEVIMSDAVEYRTIPAYTFLGCKNLRHFDIPDSVRVIDPFAFWGCCSLEEIILPDGVETIGIEAFSYCESLREVTIPCGVESVSAEVFEGCDSLEKVMLPDGIKTIGYSAFGYCESLREINIPDRIHRLLRLCRVPVP